MPDRYIYKPISTTIAPSTNANNAQNQIQNSANQQSQFSNQVFQNQFTVSPFNNNFNNGISPQSQNNQQSNNKPTTNQNRNQNQIPIQIGQPNRDRSEDIDVRFDQRPDSAIQNHGFQQNLLPSFTAQNEPSAKSQIPMKSSWIVPIILLFYPYRIRPSFPVLL